MKLIVGLGNPGLRYKNTKHNAGFWVIEKIAKEENIPFNKRKFNARYGQGKISNKSCLLLEPLTFMNLSGQAVRGFLSYFKISLKDILIILDDINLNLGEIRLRGSGTSGGHQGLNSIIELLGTEDIARLRLGIKTQEEIADLAKYVLCPFSKKEDRLEVEQMIKRAKEAVIVWVEDGVVSAMNTFNKKRREFLGYE